LLKHHLLNDLTDLCAQLQCNNFNSLSPLTPPERDLDLLTKNKVKDDVRVKGSVTSTANGDEGGVADEFSSFAFWRQPVPSVDQEDLAFILASQGRFTNDDDDDDDAGGDDDQATDFDEFNYWRVPIAELDVSDLLRCLHQL